MTCYDLRFLELALSLVLGGTELLVLSTVWVRGPQEKHHQATLLTMRAPDTTRCVVAIGKYGMRNIGQSHIVDPLGTTLAGAEGELQLIFADVSTEHLTRVRECLSVLQNRRFVLLQLL